MSRLCLNCGKPVIHNPKSHESKAVLANRFCCSRSCANRYRRKDAGDLGVRAARLRARKYVKTGCERCGNKYGLQVHHIDNDPWNNDPMNLVTLCETCHDRKHHYTGEEEDSFYE